MDILTPEQRSSMMSRIRGRHTRPERAVRHTAHALGYRYRLHRRDLPGSPDLVFPGRDKVVFVHGCYWHRHRGCRLAYVPKSNIAFWTAKFARNVDRDRQAEAQLRDAGWEVLAIWECETADQVRLAAILQGFLR